MKKKRIPIANGQIGDNYKLYKEDDKFIYYRHPTKSGKFKILKEPGMYLKKRNTGHKMFS